MYTQKFLGPKGACRCMFLSLSVLRLFEMYVTLGGNCISCFMYLLHFDSQFTIVYIMYLYQYIFLVAYIFILTLGMCMYVVTKYVWLVGLDVCLSLRRHA
jgi:hypothetical protein